MIVARSPSPFRILPARILSTIRDLRAFASLYLLRMFTNRTLWIGLFCLAMGLFAAGCTSSAPTNTLIYGRGEDANTLDPINTDIGEAVNVIVNIYDTLVTYDDRTAELVPGLAESWEHSEDGLTWTFQIRDNVKFHDGTSLTADVVKTSFDRLLQADHPLVYDKARPYQASYNMIKEVRSDGERSVIFILDRPSAIFLKNLTMFPASIVSPTAVQERGEKFAERPCGTGPFQMVAWDRDQKLVLGAFQDHWRGPPGVDHLIFVPVQENQTRIEQLKRGEIQIADNLSGFDVESLASRADITVQSQDVLNTAYLATQTEKPPLDRVDVRQAIWLAIDKQELAKVAYAGQATPAVSIVPEQMWGRAKLADRPFDPDQARQLLAAAANDAGFELPLKLSLSYMNRARPYMPRPETVAGFVKDSLEKVGFQIELVPRAVNQHFPFVMAGKHELALAGWSSDNNDPDNFLYSLLDPDNISDAGNNISRFRNAEFHKLVVEAQGELDEGKRLQLYQRAQEIAFAESPIVPLVHARANVAMSNRVFDYQLHPTGLVRLRLAKLKGQP